MKAVRAWVLVSNRLGYIGSGYKYTIKQSIIHSIVRSQFRLTSASATFFDTCLVNVAHIILTFSLFVSFAIFWTVSKVKEKGYFGEKFCNFKILFEWEIYISHIP